MMGTGNCVPRLDRNGKLNILSSFAYSRVVRSEMGRSRM